MKEELKADALYLAISTAKIYKISIQQNNPGIKTYRQELQLVKMEFYNYIHHF